MGEGGLKECNLEGTRGSFNSICNALILKLIRGYIIMIILYTFSYFK